jgi:hypothetical protein
MNYCTFTINETREVGMVFIQCRSSNIEALRPPASQVYFLGLPILGWEKPKILKK